MSNGRQAYEWPNVIFGHPMFARGFAERADDAIRAAEDRRFYNGFPEQEVCEVCGQVGAFVCDCYCPAISMSGDFRDTCGAVLCRGCAVCLHPSNLHACPAHAAWAAESEGASRDEANRERWAKARWARPKAWVTDGQRRLRLVVGRPKAKRKPVPMAVVIPLRGRP